MQTIKNTLSVTLVLFTITLFSGCSGGGEEQRSNDMQTSQMDSADELITIQEWEVPWEGRPRDPYPGPDGSIWFVGQRTHYVGRFYPQSETFERYDLDDGAGPHTVIVDSEGSPWYAGNRIQHIGKIDPSTEDITRYQTGETYLRDPHTMDFDREGNIWFTAQGGNGIGHLNINTGEFTTIPVPTERARPYGILMDHQKIRPWIVLFGTNKLATVNPVNMNLEEIELPREETRPRRLAITSDGAIWYCDYATGHIGRYNPANGEIREWAMPEGVDARPYAMTSDHKDRLWVVATGIQPNRFVGFDPNSEEFIASKAIESGGGTVRHMVFHEPTQSIWFGTDSNYLGRAQVQ